jgi:hypothetical protein
LYPAASTSLFYTAKENFKNNCFQKNTKDFKKE